MDQRQTKNGITDFDELDTGGGDVSALLRALPHAEAPGNFEFGVKARIAKGSAPARMRFVPFLKVAAPLALLFAVGSFFFYGTIEPADTPQVVGNPPVTQAAAPVIAASEAPLPLNANVAVSAPTNETSIAKRRPAPAQTRTGSSARPQQISSPERRLEGGSRDETVRAPKIIRPPGFESANPVIGNVNANVAGAQVPVRDVFEMIGINADLSGGSWKVRSVTENSLASRGKLQAGDIIESIDGQPVRRDSVPKGGAMTVTVRRDGKTINLNLKN